MTYSGTVNARYSLTSSALNSMAFAPDPAASSHRSSNSSDSTPRRSSATARTSTKRRNSISSCVIFNSAKGQCLPHKRPPEALAGCRKVSGLSSESVALPPHEARRGGQGQIGSAPPTDLPRSILIRWPRRDQRPGEFNADTPDIFPRKAGHHASRNCTYRNPIHELSELPSFAMKLAKEGIRNHGNHVQICGGPRADV